MNKNFESVTCLQENNLEFFYDSHVVIYRRTIFMLSNNTIILAYGKVTFILLIQIVPYYYCT